jgi:branched-chain amino acid transport system permease protein
MSTTTVTTSAGPPASGEMSRSSVFGVKAGFAALLALAFASLPLFTTAQFTMALGTTLMITAIAAVSLHLIIRTGHVSLAHAAFMGLGAYAAVLGMSHLSLPFPLALVLAFVVPAAVALIVGPLLLRLSGKYFVLVTFLMGEIIRLVFVSWQSVTGGGNGIFGIPLPYRILESPVAYYYFVFAFTALCMAFVARLLQSEVGRSIDAIREESRLAECSGIPVVRVKVAIFVIACGMVGVAGALSAFFIRYIDPTSFSIIQSLNLLVMNIVGGMFQMAGALIGVLFFVILPEFLRGYVELQRVIFGICLIVVMAFLPGGIVQLLGRLKQLAVARRGASE